MNSYSVALRRLIDSGSWPKMGLERMQQLMIHLGHPQDSYPSFHVAGTNGKGSTCAFLESILRTAGYRVGLYTSPHLLCARERIQINRELISEEDFAQLEARVPSDATFFERITAMAFLYFSEQNIDVAVIEVGLGGRLDATNVIIPVACGISQIALDHQKFLGETLEQIRFEKSGIIKPGIPVCWSPQPVVSYPLGLRGMHQAENAALAVSMIRASGWPIQESAIAEGLLKTSWPCRYEKVCEEPLILIDGAHNPAGTKALIASLKDDGTEPDTLLVGFTEGHDGIEMACLWKDAFPDAQIRAGQSKSLRAVSVEQVLGMFKEAGFLDVRPFDGALEAASTVVVTGSLYWTGEIRTGFIPMPQDTLSVAY